MFNTNFIVGLIGMISIGIFIVWFFGKLTKTIKTN